jgi:hypothetical protein
MLAAHGAAALSQGDRMAGASSPDLTVLRRGAYDEDRRTTANIVATETQRKTRKTETGTRT